MFLFFISIIIGLCILGALLGGESFGECLRLGVGFIIFLCLIVYFYNKDPEPKPYTPVIPQCERCGGDGELNESELNNFLMSDVLEDENTIKVFQDWMDLNHPGWVKGENLHTPNGSVEVRGDGITNGYGTFGPKSRNAYIRYKYEWLSFDSNSSYTCALCGE
jgi:hypothetical protein